MAVGHDVVWFTFHVRRTDLYLDSCYNRDSLGAIDIGIILYNLRLSTNIIEVQRYVIDTKYVIHVLQCIELWMVIDMNE